MTLQNSTLKILFSGELGGFQLSESYYNKRYQGIYFWTIIILKLNFVTACYVEFGTVTETNMVHISQE